MVEVMGQNYAGVWQSLPTKSRTWTVIVIARSDFDQDGDLDTNDLDLLCAAIRANDNDPTFDQNDDLELSVADLNWVVAELLGTTPGDANLDGLFDSQDIVEVFRAGKYESGDATVARWSEGDWNCDGAFDTRDLVFAFQNSRYQPA